MGVFVGLVFFPLSPGAAEAGGTGRAAGMQEEAGRTCSQLPSARAHLHRWKTTRLPRQLDKELLFWELHFKSQVIFL